MKDQIAINGQDGAFRAYIARPESLPAPAVAIASQMRRNAGSPSITGRTKFPERIG